MNTTMPLPVRQILPWLLLPWLVCAPLPLSAAHEAGADDSVSHPADAEKNPEAEAADAILLNLNVGEPGVAGEWKTGAAIVGGTFVSEDLTLIGTGLLVRQNRVAWKVGLLACFVGVFVGDLGLWLLGWGVGGRMIRWRRLKKYFPDERLEAWRAWYDKNGWAAVVASRFLPGTRWPVYVGAGVLGRRVGRFMLWVFLAGLIWTPLLVVLTASLGYAVVRPLEVYLGSGWWSFLVSLALVFLLYRVIFLAATREGRYRLWAKLSVLWRWEFWPSWLYYLPAVGWFAWWTFKYRGVGVFTVANPGFERDGVVGESKEQILALLPERWTLASQPIHAGPAPEERAIEVLEAMARRGWSFPLVLKPDAAQRGAAMRVARDEGAVLDYFRKVPVAVIAQVYHPGPYEAGIYYYRLPTEEHGHIFSITDKVFPDLVGDGRATIRELIWRQPRCRMQGDLFMKRHKAALDRVLAEGERFRLVIAGNHCQGTYFLDGEHLITPALTARVDEIARAFPGFYIGRFDVRYADSEKFKAGEDLAIIELNGTSALSTNIYDPRHSLLDGYRIQYRQFELLYKVGALNARFGHKPRNALFLLFRIIGYYMHRSLDTLSD